MNPQRTFSLPIRLLSFAAALVGCFLLELAINRFVGDFYVRVITQAISFVTLGVSLNLINGITGQFSIGHAGFAMVGGFTGGLVCLHGLQPMLANSANKSVLQAVFVIIAVLFGGLISGVLGLIGGFPSIRLRGDYLAVVTLGISEIVQNISRNVPQLGKAFGLSFDPIQSIFTISLLAVITIAVSRNILQTVHGLGFLSVREDEVASSSMGVPVTKLKLSAFVLGSFFAGAAGAALVLSKGVASPSEFTSDVSYLILTMVVLGGTGSISGTILASIALTTLPEVLRSLTAVPMHLVLAGLVGFIVAVVLIKRAQDLNIAIGRKRIFYIGAIGAALLLILGLNMVGKSFAGQVPYFALNVGGGPLRQPVVAMFLVAFMLLRPQGIFGHSELGAASLFKGLRRKPEQLDPTVEIPVIPTDKSQVVLRLTDATIKFGGLTAVNNVSFEINQGDLFGIIGPNGAGKTTCFNLITGVYAPTGGSIEFFGRRIEGTPSNKIAKLGICRTFQNIRLFTALSAIENVMIGGFLRHKGSLFSAMLYLPSAIAETDSARKMALSILDVVGLADVADVKSGDLPYGKQRRLEIARALATQPKLLLLDEPAAGMNPQEKIELLTMVKQIRDHLGVTVLLIEHDMKFVMNLCEKIIVLDHGEEISQGTPDQVRNDPKVIAAYLGAEV